MARDFSSFQLGLPRFRAAVRNLIVINTGIFIFVLLLRAFVPSLGEGVAQMAKLYAPGSIFEIWRFLTYGFVHLDPFNFLLGMVGIFFLGSAVESRLGSRAFVELY